MNWRNHIYKYQPINEQEMKDKEIFLFCMKHFDDILTRKNPLIHITSSSFIVNKDFNSALMVYHNIYNSWSWTGGHVDGDEDFIKVAIKEAKEETGIQSLELFSNDILSLDVLTVIGHVKKGVVVSPHLHLSIAYGGIADDAQTLRAKKDENTAVKWIPMNRVVKYSTEAHMKNVYEKLINKMTSCNQKKVE